MAIVGTSGSGKTTLLQCIGGLDRFDKGLIEIGGENIAELSEQRLTELRNRKNDRGEWEKVPVYAVDDQFPYGHGEKSVFLIERFMRLRTEEAIAVRWHMGGFDDAVRGGSFAVSDAYNTYPSPSKLHIADLTATYLMEQGTSNVENGHPKTK